MDHKEWMAQNGRKGGKASGPRKARSSEVARAAALKRWRPEAAEVSKEMGHVFDAAFPKDTDGGEVQELKEPENMP